MPNAPPRVSSNSGEEACSARIVTTASVPDRRFGSPRAEIWPDWEVMGGTWQNGRVTAVRSLTHRVSLVARRHVDFKRVCTCSCLP
ncbi:Ms4527A family Cys-rich leader peptide [[Mycobacterium] wendilense]|uniref:Ms4527A family Cys-rich leader peptide n=1 Tax=[Mycobacterium] wendilense TaxID=3064284 RepID=UPI0037CA462F